MNSQKPIILPPDGGTPLLVLGSSIIIKIHGRDTGGVFSQVVSGSDPQTGPPLHVHTREDETFYVLEGEFEAICGDQRLVLKPGSVAFLPRNIPHTFKCVGQSPGRILVTITPAGFEGFFEEVGALNPAEQRDIPRVTAIGEKYGLKIAGPPL